MKHFWGIPLGKAILAFAFVWVYRRGKEDKPFLAQGLRYGLAAAALIVLPNFLTQYAVLPLPLSLSLKQIVFESSAIVVLGMVVAALHK